MRQREQIETLVDICLWPKVFGLSVHIHLCIFSLIIGNLNASNHKEILDNSVTNFAAQFREGPFLLQYDNTSCTQPEITIF